MDPREFIDLGKSISKDRNYPIEPRYRTAINRIYYGLLHFVIVLKRIIGIDYKKFHRDVVEKLSKDDHVLGNLLYNMSQLRVEADYDLNSSIDHSDVNLALKYHNRIMKRLETDLEEL